MDALVEPRHARGNASRVGLADSLGGEHLDSTDGMVIALSTLKGITIEVDRKPPADFVGVKPAILRDAALDVLGLLRGED